MKLMDINSYIRDHYLQQSDDEMAIACNISNDAVKSRRYHLKLYRPIKKDITLRPIVSDMPQVKTIKDGLKRAIILSDMHVPYHDVKAVALVEQYMVNNRYDIYGNIGDFLDMDTISSFNKGRPGNTEGRYLIDDFTMANKILDRHQEIIRRNNPDATFFYLEGNHEERVNRFMAEAPHLKGLLDIKSQLRLDERGIEWIPSWSERVVHHIGKAGFVHGRYTNKYHAAKMVDTYGQSIFYGHTHDIMCHPKINEGDGSLYVGQSIGCLCEYRQQYLKGSPTNWQQGFMELFLLPSGHFTYHITRIIDNEFVGLDGKLYTL